MSETIGQPENGRSNLHERLAEARDLIKTADINLEHAQKARHEALAEYTGLVRSMLSKREIVFSGRIDTGAVQGQDGREWTERSDYLKNQRAKVGNIFVDGGPFGDIQTKTYLQLVDGEDSGWHVSVFLERIEWNIVEKSEEE